MTDSGAYRGTAGVTDTGGDAAAAQLAVLAELARQASGQAGAENFPVALRVLPRRPRDLLARVYAFARFVDDVGDEAPGDRCALLDLIEADLSAESPATADPSAGTDPPRGAARLAPVRGLGPVLAAGVAVQPFRDLIEANRVDQRVHAYPTFDDLLGYCALSAAPVGRIVLHIAGRAGAQNIADSDAVCNALQVLEHCQDVGEDAAAGRVYLPGDDLAAARVLAADLTGAGTSEALRNVIAVQVTRAERMLRPGRSLLGRLSGWSRVAVAGYLAGGHATIAALRAADYEVLAAPVRPGKARTAATALRLVAGR